MVVNNRNCLRLITFFWLVLSANIAMASCEKWVAKIASVQGQVEAKRAATSNWQAVKLDDTYCPGDQIRVNANSRAAIILVNETLLRLDQHSAIKLTAIKAKQASIIELIKGIGHFISRVPRSLKVETPTMNAAIEGTEFVVAVSNKESRITVFEGTVLASNNKGEVRLNSGDSAVASKNAAPHKSLLAKPRDAVQWALYYPPILDPGLKKSDPVYQAASMLNAGRVTEASRLLKKAPRTGNRQALQAIIAVVTNDKTSALTLATEAVQLAPNTASTHIALSYAHQAHFNLEQALHSALQATVANQHNALAWARVAELQLSSGEMADALSTAQKAVSLDSQLSRTQTVLGFAHLLQIDIEVAKQDFERAIKLDQTDPLPRLGLGLAKIRGNDLGEGRREIEIAASLDPNNAIIRSYLGKAYFEEKRSPLDTEQFDMAKGLDPFDPTPWLYDAIAKQTENRPAEALSSLQKSIELNDNRAVYRSSLQLDQDSAARSASQARIYSDLGFDQLALQQAYTSLNRDPANHSAHRLLADAYATMPRHEIARVSELLQAQLLQPVSNHALQPQLGVSALATTNNVGPAQLAFNEFNPLFVSDGLSLQANGVSGTNNTNGHDVVVSGILSNLAFSLGQYNYKTDGFRKNNDLQEEVSNAFVQYDITPTFSIQAEKRRYDNDRGDINMNFDPADFSTTDRRKVRQDSERLGIHYQPTANSDLLLSYIEADRTGLEQLVGQVSSPALDQTLVSESTQSEIQYLYNKSNFNITAGLSRYNLIATNGKSFDWSALIPPFVKCPPSFTIEQCETQSSYTLRNEVAYLYGTYHSSADLSWSLGLNYDRQENHGHSISEANPKAGMQWAISRAVQLRLAYLESTKKALTVQQTLEPSTIAGFNQFYDDISGTKAKQQSLGLDARLSPTLSSGLEVTRRDLTIPEFSTSVITYTHRKDDLYRLHLYWLPSTVVSFTGEYQLSQIENTTGVGPTKLDTTRIPLTVHFRYSDSLYSQLVTTHVKQEVALPASSSFTQTKEDFTVVDLSVGYRLAKRRGTVSLGINNLLDKAFIYQDLNYTRSEAINPRYSPARTVMARLALSF